MKKSMLLAGAALLFSAAASPALAQSTIAPGMTEEQVRGRFGDPATTRAAGAWTYWYYHNGCPVRCGSDDVVFFQNDRVVAAVLRTSRRRFAGPAADDAINANPVSDRQGQDAPADDGRARVGGVRVEGAASEVIIVPAARADDDDRDRPQAREGRPGEPSTMVITVPEAAPAAPAGTPTGQAREGRPGEPATTVITVPEAAPASAAGTNPPAADGPLPTTDATPAPARNTEAADTRGETSIDRKNRRERQDRANEPPATVRARQNDRRDP